MMLLENTRRILALIVVLAVASMPIVGCMRTKQPTNPPAEEKKEAVEDDATDSPTVKSAEGEVVVTSSVEQLDNSPSTEPDEPPFIWPDDSLRERVVLLMPGGPLVLDAWISVNGRPLQEGVSELINQAYNAGDTNGDKRRTWKEWRANTEFFAKALPNQIPTKQQLDNWVEKYDQNRDHRIQTHEIAAWLGRDSGRSANPLTLRSRQTRDSSSNIDSRLWNLLDRDASGGLSNAEVEQATSLLWSLDADDDRTIKDAELTPLEQQLSDSQTNSVRLTRVAQRHAALHFGAHFDTGRLGYLLADRYSPRTSLSSASFADFPHLFNELIGVDLQSEGNDRQLSDAEIARLATIPPHVRVAIAYGDEADGENNESGNETNSRGENGTAKRPTVTNLVASSRVAKLKVAAQPSKERIVLTLGKSRIVLSVHDLSGESVADDKLRRSQVQLMVHDECDVLFEYLDDNSDGRLGEREVVQVGKRLKECDADGDGLLSSGELPYTMIVAFQRGENPATRNFYVPESPAVSIGNGDAPAWFIAADFNGDGDLGRREFLGSADAFNQMDTNSDGFIEVHEAIFADKQ